MKIPNYDTNQKTFSRNLNDFLDEDFRMLIAGQSGCGKTNTLIHILKTPLVYFDKIYLFTPNQHQEKLQNLQKLMEKLSEKVGYDILEMGGEDEIPNTNYYPANNRKVVVFDDLVNSCEKVQNRIANHFTDGRHHNISPIYLSQSYFDIPQKTRQNCTHMILYKPSTKNHLGLIAKENMIDPSLFEKLKPFEFLFVDKTKNTVAKNFDEAI